GRQGFLGEVRRTPGRLIVSGEGNLAVFADKTGGVPVIYKLISFAMAFSICFIVYHRSLAITMSPLASGVFAGFVFTLVLPIIMIVVAALVRHDYKGAAFLLIIPTTLAICILAGSKFAAWLHRDPFIGGIVGAGVALFLLIAPLSIVM